MGHRSVSTVVGALSARSAVGHAICEHGRQRYCCKNCGGGAYCEHGRVAHTVQGVRVEQMTRYVIQLARFGTSLDDLITRLRRRGLRL